MRGTPSEQCVLTLVYNRNLYVEVSHKVQILLTSTTARASTPQCEMPIDSIASSMTQNITDTFIYAGEMLAMFGLLVAAPMVLGSERFGPRGESMGSVKVVLFSTGNSAATNRYCSSPLIFLFIFSTQSMMQNPARF